MTRETLKRKGRTDMEPIIVLVGFLGAGKTTLLRRLVDTYLKEGWDPTIILNDYENATLDAERFLEFLDPCQIQALSGSCICCTGVQELRRQVNDIEAREKGITFIEANGTTDAVSLMEFLGVGLSERFLPPVQISVVDCQNWQGREFMNELEANQVQVSSLVFLNHHESVDKERIDLVREDIQRLNPSAEFRFWEEFNPTELVTLDPSRNKAEAMDHKKAHWSSCSAPLPDPLPSWQLKAILDSLPDSILRVKACTRLDDDDHYTYIEKTPSNKEAILRPYSGTLVTGPMILTVGPGSDPQSLAQIILDTKKL